MASFLPHVNHFEICKLDLNQPDNWVVQFIFGPIARDNNVTVAIDCTVLHTV